MTPNRDRVANTVSNLERIARHAPVAENESPYFDSPVRVTIHSYRKRIADPDGLSAKAVLDGIVRHGGILADDSAKQIKEIRFEQTKADEEKTVIVIEELE